MTWAELIAAPFWWFSRLVLRAPQPPETYTKAQVDEAFFEGIEHGRASRVVSAPADQWGLQQAALKQQHMQQAGLKLQRDMWEELYAQQMQNAPQRSTLGSALAGVGLGGLLGGLMGGK